MEVNLIRENEDGSADYTFDMTEAERQALMRFAIIESLKRGIEEGKKLAVKEDSRQLDLFEGENENEA
jgi:hypothetical protein